MRTILRWKTRILIFLSTLSLFIMLQGFMVPGPEKFSNSGNLATTLEDDYFEATRNGIDNQIEEENIVLVQQGPGVSQKHFLLGSSGFVSQLPQIQRTSTRETVNQQLERETRREAIKEGFKHAWRGYKEYAMGHDELKPLTNKPADPFGGWGATVADAISTMLVMELFEEFEDATATISTTNFSITEAQDISTFETIIRYLGGFLSAYELSGDKRMLQKAEEVGKVVIAAFDTNSGLPYHRWNMGRETIMNPWVSFAEVASVQMEFTTLTRHSGNPVYAEKAQTIIDHISTAGLGQGLYIRGLYPYTMDVITGKFTSTTSSFGAMGDSSFEYFLKQYLLVDGQDEQYARLYKESIAGMKKHMIRQTSKSNLLFLHPFDTRAKIIGSTMDHLSCFAPGMLAIGAKVFDEPEDLVVAKGLLETCVHMYLTSKTGLCPEKWTFHDSKPWDPKTYKPDQSWKPEDDNVPDREELDDSVSGLGNKINKQVIAFLEKLSNSMTQVQSQTDDRLTGIFVSDGAYLLRPETVESLFVLYRITGDRRYQDYGWEIWQAIEKYCKTPSAYSAIRNVNFDATASNLTDYTSIQTDQMESFFFAETLKYLYLLFSPDNIISLDKFVFNTEAHPLLRRSSEFDTHVLDLNFGRAK